MKNKIIKLAIAMAAIFTVACNSANKPAATNTENDTSTPVITSPANAASTNNKLGVDAKTSASVREMTATYLQLKNALTKDNSSDAATAGKALSEDFSKLDKSALTPKQNKTYTDIAVDAKEMAEHIGMSGGKLPHQREHFDMLSKDMVDLLKLFGAGQPLYVDHCPMYNNKKGAIWLSESKGIKNPYMGSAMSTCGTIQEELK